MRAGDGTFRGGPAFIQRGLGSRPGVLFAVLLVFTFDLPRSAWCRPTPSPTFSTPHAVRSALRQSVLVLLAAVLFGGVRRVAKVAEVVLPLMALA